MEKHWFIFSGSLGRQCWDRAIMYRSLKERERDGKKGEENGRNEAEYWVPIDSRTQMDLYPPQSLLLFSIVDEEEEFTGFVDR